MLCIQQAKKQRRFKNKSDKRRTSSDFVVNMTMQKLLKAQDPPLCFHDEKGQPVDKDFLPSVPDCQKFMQMMAVSFPDVVEMKVESIVIADFKSVVATGRGKSKRVREYVFPIVKLYIDTYLPHLIGVQEARRNMQPISDSNSDEGVFV